MRALFAVAAMCVIGFCGNVRAQAPEVKELHIGDPAPTLHVAEWIKGGPVDLEKEKGQHIYLIEFWATWCGPCWMSMPHLNELQKQYKDKGLVVVAMSDEPKSTVAPVVEKQGDKMDFVVAIDQPTQTGMGSLGKTSTTYMMGAGLDGVPAAFVIAKDGRIAWFGYSAGNPQLDEVLAKVVKGEYDIDKAVATSKADAKFFKEQQTVMAQAMEKADWKLLVEHTKKVLDPSNPISKELRVQIANEVAWILLTDDKKDSQYYKDALLFAQSANELTDGNDPTALDTYARALFETGDIPHAVEFQKKAVEHSDGPVKEEMQKTLKKYETAQQEKQPSDSLGPPGNVLKP